MRLLSKETEHRKFRPPDLTRIPNAYLVNRVLSHQLTRYSSTTILKGMLNNLKALNVPQIPTSRESDKLSPIEIAELKISRAERARGLSKTFDNVRDLIRDLNAD